MSVVHGRMKSILYRQAVYVYLLTYIHAQAYIRIRTYY